MEKMENDSMESHTISKDVPRMGLDNENLDYVENSRINLRGVLHMNSGNDAASYAENSQRQGHVLHALQPLLKVAIERLRFLHEGPLRIADMGCATGINTVSGVDFVVKTLVNMWGNGHSNGGGSVTEYQAYFVDLPSNDFNGLFNLLDRPASPYFVAGVPGSFYNVLFPRSSIHVCFSVLSLHWLSQVPEAVVQKSSPLYNKGRVWINRGRQDIAEAYSKQSQKDLNAFFSCRAREMAPGGVLFLCTMGRPDTWPPQEQLSVREEFCGQDFEDAWDELVTQGIVSSVLRDSFNMPWYFVSPEELRQAADNCGAFEMESIQVCEGIPCMSSEELAQYIRDPKTFGLMKSTFVKSYMGALIEAHIGKECTDKLFEVFAEKATALLHCNPPSGLATCTGIVSSDLRDSFNMPWYFVSPEELRQAADNCGAFEMESIQVCEGIPCMSSEELEQYIRDPKTFGLMKSTFVKSYMGALIEAHIGKECTDKLFELFAEKATALLHCNPPSGLATCTVSSLIRK